MRLSCQQMCIKKLLARSRGLWCASVIEPLRGIIWPDLWRIARPPNHGRSVRGDPNDPYECDNWQTLHPVWIFCDDFESGAALVADGRFFEYDDDSGDFVVLDGSGFQNSRGMRAFFQAGEVSAGSLKLGFGRNPSAYMNRGIRPTEDFREVYYRMYLKMRAGWQGNPAKLSRATVFASDD